MTEAITEPSNRPGNTGREFAKWLGWYPGDESLMAGSLYVGQVVEDWRSGTIDKLEALHKIYGFYTATDGDVSEITSCALHQAGMWFSYEAEISVDEDMEILQQYM